LTIRLSSKAPTDGAVMVIISKINVSGKEYEDGDHGNFYSSDGIIVIRKGAIIPDGTEI